MVSFVFVLGTFLFGIGKCEFGANSVHKYTKFSLYLDNITLAVTPMWQFNSIL